VFIRWVVRGHKNSHVANVTFHDAYLVESYRDADGEPRQRTISYLGNIRQIGDDFPPIERALFLLRTEHILNSLDVISPADHDQIMEQIQKRISPLTHDEVMVGFLNTLRWHYRWWNRHGGTPANDDVMDMVKLSKETIGAMQIDKWD